MTVCVCVCVCGRTARGRRAPFGPHSCLPPPLPGGQSDYPREGVERGGEGWGGGLWGVGVCVWGVGASANTRMMP